MAVQAQYPSNVLLLNSKRGQEGHDYSLQSQPGGLGDHQSHMLFNNEATNSRKRGREATVGMGVVHTSQNVMNQFSLQSQSPQLIDLTQLHNHQQNVVSTGLRLSFGDQQQQQQQQLQRLQLLQQQQRQQQEQQRGSQSSAFLSVLSQGLASQIKQQRDEIDLFIQAQGEQLRRALAEKRQRHYRALLSAAEESVARRLNEKEAEVKIATRRNAELEARAAQLSVEAQVWQAKAKAQEAMAVSLQAQLQHAMMSGEKRSGEDGGGVSCAVGVEGQAEDAESAYVDPERVVLSGPKCKGCGKRVASVVVLPCRHLCVCTECDRHLRACPVCLTVKTSTVEVYLS
ncbi:BOI-related E3 ubiquitin-protein ligase 1-like isoform X1 [Gastrolobium bilobum]|uniref:BOI-related E3 ubiquitin-protein ligase 1-like isoform X1 n=1 Tax=Gastrolobium bilobum TaxID=150636 RepID=UPI002AB2986D|nr:BOI-related E3 ubiquitin-protein ligase 1-like isoform X1 [Gastrolobium bilobum]